MSKTVNKKPRTRDARGKFLPGQRPVGRAKGKQNKVTEAVKARFQQLMDSYSIQQMKKDLMELEPNERLKIITGLLDFFIPKLNRTDHSLQGKSDIIIVQLPAPPTPLNPPVHTDSLSVDGGRLDASSTLHIEAEEMPPLIQTDAGRLESSPVSNKK